MKLYKTLGAFFLSAAMISSLTPAFQSFAATESSVAVQSSAEATDSSEIGQGFMNGKQRTDILQQLVDSGSISQSTCDAIKAYLQENTPQNYEDGKNRNAVMGSSGTAANSDENAERPERPEKTADNNNEASLPASNNDNNGARGRRPAFFGSQLLNNMLEAGVITQTDFDAISSALPKPEERGGSSSEAAEN